MFKVKNVILFFVGFIVFLSTLRCVPVGHKGVVKHFGEVQHELTLGEGLHFVTPIRTEIVRLNVKLVSFDSQAEASSKDLQTVKTLVTIQFALTNVSHLFQNIGSITDIQNIVLVPSVMESVKAVTALYTAEELITKRAEAKVKIHEEIKDFVKVTLENKGVKDSIVISNVAITDFDFSPEFNQSIEAKVKAEQLALQALNEKKEKITRAEAEAKSIELVSVAKANAIRREAKALTANKKLVDWKRAEKWDGKLPQYTGSYIPFLNVNEGGK